MNPTLNEPPVLEETVRDILDGQCPLEIEIGCGKSKFLIARAQEHPKIHFVATDRVLKWMKIGKTRAEKRGLQNLSFLKVEAREFLKSCVPLNRVDVFYVLFSSQL